MEVKSVGNQSFGALNCEPSLKRVQYHIATRLGMDSTIKCDEYLKKLALCKNTADLLIFHNGKKDRLYAYVGDNVYKENFFRSPLGVLKKVLKVLQKLDAKEQL